MKELTIGKLEDQLRKFPKDTQISLTCMNCHHGSIGSEDILDIIDNTDQTFGYIEMIFNNTNTPKIEVAKDKDEFYTREIERLTNENIGLRKEVKKYERKIERIGSAIKFDY